MAEATDRVALIRGKTGAVDPAVIAAPGKGVAILEGELSAALGAEIPARIRMRRGVPQLRLRMPRTAPPGLYDATLNIEGRNYPISIEVPTRSRLRVIPAALQFSGAPGEKSTTTFRIQNRGNTSVELPRHAFAGAFADDGLATAFSSSYEMDSDDAMQLFQNFVLRLRDSYGGLIKLRIEGADTPLAPGEQRELTGTITIPSQDSVRGNLRLGKGRKFHAIFHYGDLRLVGRISISG